MATSYTWPSSLPQKPNVDFSESGGVLIIRSPMDSGPAKQRKIGNRPQVLNMSFDMTSTQVSTFETFVKSTISGTARFSFSHPRTEASLEVRIVPSGDGELYQLQYITYNAWKVVLKMEILP